MQQLAAAAAAISRNPAATATCLVSTPSKAGLASLGVAHVTPQPLTNASLSPPHPSTRTTTTAITPDPHLPAGLPHHPTRRPLHDLAASSTHHEWRFRLCYCCCWCLRPHLHGCPPAAGPHSHPACLAAGSLATACLELLLLHRVRAVQLLAGLSVAITNQPALAAVLLSLAGLAP